MVDRDGETVHVVRIEFKESYLLDFVGGREDLVPFLLGVIHANLEVEADENMNDYAREALDKATEVSFERLWERAAGGDEVAKQVLKDAYQESAW